MGLTVDRGEFICCRNGFDDNDGFCVDGTDGGAVADTPAFGGPQTHQVIHIQSLKL